MKTIYKYKLQHFDECVSECVIKVPAFVAPLTVQFQDEWDQASGSKKIGLCLWAEVDDDPEQQQVLITIAMVGTGRKIPEGDWQYISTIQAGAFVWHFYWQVKLSPITN